MRAYIEAYLRIFFGDTVILVVVSQVHTIFLEQFVATTVVTPVPLALLYRLGYGEYFLVSCIHIYINWRATRAMAPLMSLALGTPSDNGQ